MLYNPGWPGRSSCNSYLAWLTTWLALSDFVRANIASETMVNLAIVRETEIQKFSQISTGKKVFAEKGQVSQVELTIEPDA